jgi:hypothetical protein
MLNWYLLVGVTTNSSLSFKKWLDILWYEQKKQTSSCCSSSDFVNSYDSNDIFFLTTTSVYSHFKLQIPVCHQGTLHEPI